jgi:cytosine/adenosine deaminase-related metal-dependent hydrolase
MPHKNYFFQQLDEELEKLGGLFNAHAHIDRFATAGPQFHLEGTDHHQYEILKLWDKQTSTELLHQGKAYERQSLEYRMSIFLKESIQAGVTRLDSFVDVAEDISLESGMGALNTALYLKRKFAKDIDFRVGAYAPFGFRYDKPQTWEHFVESAQYADFIATSPERDDPIFYKANTHHIGLKNHFLKTLELTLKLNKPIHYHLDQQVNPNEHGTESLLKVVEDFPYRKELEIRGNNEPIIWAVHVISPSTYSKSRLENLIDKLAAFNIGVICCPSAGISMRKLTFLNAPINKSIAEILLMLSRGITVRIGTDNVDDMFLPATTLDPRREIPFLANALRFYSPLIYATLLSGKPLGQYGIELIDMYLETEKQILNTYKK